MRDEVGQFRRFAGIGQRQHGVARHDHAEVAVRRLGRMDEQRGGAGGGQRGGDLAATWPDLPMPETTTRPVAAASTVDRAAEVLAQAGGKRAQAGGLGRQHVPRDIEVGTGRFGEGRGAIPLAVAASLGHASIRASCMVPTRSVPGSSGVEIIEQLRQRQTVANGGSRVTLGRSVRENIRVFVAQQIQPRPGRQEREAGFGQLEPVFANQQRLQLRPQRVQVQHVGGGVGELLGRQLQRAPVRGLLLLVTVRPPAVPCTDPCRPCRSVKVRTSLAAILVQRTGATVMPRVCCSTATSNRAKCISFTTPGSASRRFEVGAVEAAAAE